MRSRLEIRKMKKNPNQYIFALNGISDKRAIGGSDLERKDRRPGAALDLPEDLRPDGGLLVERGRPRRSPREPRPRMQRCR